MVQEAIGPNRIDVHVGQRVRLRRKQLELSQERLAAALRLTFQQVQKYERGANRISASKLYEIARELKVPVGFFYEGLDDTSTAEGEAYTRAWSQVFEGLLSDPTGPALAEAYLAIRRKSVRKAFVDMARVIAANDEDGEALRKPAAE